MRIIGGTARGRRLKTPPGSTAKKTGRSIRPTSDRAREALFNIIGSEIVGVAVLDLFAGTGALGLEALSRSAGRAVFVDHSVLSVKIINENIELCGFSDRSLVLKRDLSKGLSFLTKQLPGEIFSVIFIDAPYRLGLSEKIMEELLGTGCLAPEALVVIEDDSTQELPSGVSGLQLADRRRYGETGFWFYRRDRTAE